MNTLDKLLARIHTAELAAKVGLRRAHHEHRDGRGGGRSHPVHHPKPTPAHHSKHGKGHGR
jgi:hypothetical protein